LVEIAARLSTVDASVRPLMGHADADVSLGLSGGPVLGARPVAARRVRWKHARAADGAVREALAKVAADEARHATLAWQFVRWVLATDPAGLRVTALAGLRAAVDAEFAAAEPPGPSRDVAPALAAHGYVDDALRREIRQRVMMDVVAPCARALAGAARARTQEEALS